MLDASEHGEINAMAISKEGEHFVTGGEDKRLKVWSYDEGMCYFGGVGHSGSISKVRLLNKNLTIITDRDFPRPKIHCECWNRGRHLHLALTRGSFSRQALKMMKEILRSDKSCSHLLASPIP